MRTLTVTVEMLRDSRSLVITRTEAAQVLGVDPLTITAGIDTGTIPSVKLGRRVVIPREKVPSTLRPERVSARVRSLSGARGGA